MIKLSIIIPMYNVEKYIGKCLDSCLNQDLPKDEYEIIVVDDGSTDNSKLIVEKYSTINNNIVIIHQNNCGQSTARNQGMAIARGDFVWFVDSDDWIQPKILDYLLNKAYNEQLDTLCFTFQFVDEDGNVYNGGFNLPSLQNPIDGKIFITNYEMPAGPWCAIHRREFLLNNKIKFIEGIKREDEDYTIRAYCSAERISYDNIIAYNYFQRIGSTMKSGKNIKTAYDLLTVADSLYEFSNSIKSTSESAYLTVLNKVSFAFSQSLAYFDENFMDIELYKSKPYYPLSVNHLLSFKESVKYRIINFSIGLYLALYKMK